MLKSDKQQIIQSPALSAFGPSIIFLFSTTVAASWTAQQIVKVEFWSGVGV